MVFNVRWGTVLFCFQCSDSKGREGVAKGAVERVVLVLCDVFPYFGVVVEAVVFFSVSLVPEGSV